MKTSKLLLIFSIIQFGLKAQTIISGQPFTKIEIENSAKVILKQDAVCSVKYAEENSKVNNSPASVKNGTLIVSFTGGNDLIVSMPVLEELIINGQGSFTGDSVFTVDRLKLLISGDGKMNLNLAAKSVEAKIGGLGKINLKGSSLDADYSITGSGKIDASGMKTIRTNVQISGLGKCIVDVEDDLTVDVSGNGTVLYTNKPKNINQNITGSGVVKPNSMEDESKYIKYPDTTRFTLGNKQIWIIGKKDSLHVKKEKAKPIWAGFELGLNSYLDNGGSFTLSPGKKNFELRTEKSVSVALNLLQQNIELGRSNIWLFSGLGITWNNYRFEKNIILENGAQTTAIVDTNSSIRHLKSKLTASYLTAPLMLEFLTSRNPKKAFHLGAGGIFGVRIGSHTKRKIEIDGDEAKIKEFDDFNLNPFRYGFRVAVGYGKFNLFADYYASTLFKNNRGPVLYPVNAGITFVGF